ncbi:hypothetical protein JK611_04455 [Staphylococcus aureus]|uniref:hypothetical protein n=1 Tax=Staphylococcus aureus TaxID=1280 RepID=UPI00115AB7F1|nr:hypothetical protein [Staphylococcus aureus]MBM0947023.1 hypothetical protein [Staphylococcus aureus]MBM0949815.1 hypothetical protein [Staphylococcus aureus]MBM0980580.1 hypothetical protein [Staphylococcus aureus]MBM0983368.1 hypothetical protein [Staphylococcus aureus]MBM0991360.1 hypothetical protein [Staphylococcus aureus]
MKKVIGLLLVSTLALTACGEKEKPKKEENKKSHTQKHKDSKPKKQKEKTKKVEDKNPPINSVQNNATNQSQAQNNQFSNHSDPSNNTPANINENDSQNTNLNDEYVVSPGWTKDEQAKAFEEYKKGKEEEARAGASAVPGANIN